MSASANGLRAALLVLASIAASGCSDEPRALTEVVIEIERDSEVNAATSSLFIQVWALEGEDAACVRDDCWRERSTVELPKDELPGRVTQFPIVPAGGDASRVFEVIAQARDADGEALVEQRAVSGFIAGRSARLRLSLVGRCLMAGPACRPDPELECHGTTCPVCREGSCQATGEHRDDGHGHLVHAPAVFDAGLDAGDELDAGDAGDAEADAGSSDAGDADAETDDAGQAPTPDQLAFHPITEHTAPIPGPFEALSGDFNRDGRIDLLWNHKSALHGNRFYIAYGTAEGTLVVPESPLGLVSHAHDLADPARGDWSSYRTLVGDFNNDGCDDIVWSHLNDANVFYVAFAQPDGPFMFRRRLSSRKAPSELGYRTRPTWVT